MPDTSATSLATEFRSWLFADTAWITRKLDIDGISVATVQFADDPPGAVAKHCGVYGEGLARGPGRITGIPSTFASPNSAFPCRYRRLRSVRREELRPELLESTVRPGGHRALIALPAGVRPQLLYYFSSKFMPDHVAWHAERLRRG